MVALSIRQVDPKGQVPPELREIARYERQVRSSGQLAVISREPKAMHGACLGSKAAASQYGALALSIDDPVKRAQVIAKGYNELVPDGETLKITGKAPDGGAKFELHDPRAG
jgi:hypothetical protein